MLSVRYVPLLKETCQNEAHFHQKKNSQELSVMLLCGLLVIMLLLIYARYTLGYTCSC